VKSEISLDTGSWSEKKRRILPESTPALRIHGYLCYMRVLCPGASHGIVLQVLQVQVQTHELLYVPVQPVVTYVRTQVEMVTHDSPARRLWMGPQFHFKPVQSAGNTHVLSAVSR